MNSTFKTENIRLEVEQFTENFCIPMEQLVGAKVEVRTMLTAWMNGFEVRVVAYLGEHRVMDRKETFPTTRWDAVKDRFFPVWLRRYFPIRYTTIEVRVGELATKWKLPENFGPWQIMRWDRREDLESIMESKDMDNK